jgi:hypothetical protein
VSGEISKIKYYELSSINKNKIAVWAVSISTVLSVVYYLLIPIYVKSIQNDILLLTGLILLIQIVQFVMKKELKVTWLDRVSLYIFITLSCFLSLGIQQQNANVFVTAELPFYLILALSVLAGFRYTKNPTFKINTLDFLVIFSVITIPNIMANYELGNTIGIFLAKLFVLFYSIELILSHTHSVKQIRILKFVTIATALYYSFIVFK